MNRIVSCLACIVTLGIFYFLCIHHTEKHEVAIGWNWVSGELWLDDVAGYSLTPPWVMVSRIDTRPARVCITSAAKAFNCKLVRFEPKFWREFVAVQGFRYYWLSNRLSFNSGYQEEYRGMRDIVRGYAFSSTPYPFVVTINPD